MNHKALFKTCFMLGQRIRRTLREACKTAQHTASYLCLGNHLVGVWQILEKWLLRLFYFIVYINPQFPMNVEFHSHRAEISSSRSDTVYNLMPADTSVCVCGDLTSIQCIKYKKHQIASIARSRPWFCLLSAKLEWQHTISQLVYYQKINKQVGWSLLSCCCFKISSAAVLLKKPFLWMRFF